MIESQAFTPLIVRIAGLPVSSIECFSNSAYESRLNDWSCTAEEIKTQRQSFVDELYSNLKDSPLERRRTLLSLKRDCFNGRQLAKYLTPRYSLHLSATEIKLLNTIQNLEQRLELLWEDLDRDYSRQLTKERQNLKAILQDSVFLRGVALGSPTLASRAHQLSGIQPLDFGRRERKLEQGLLRYASRAALKLSPFSTLTRVSLGEALPSVGTQITLFGDRQTWNQRSLTRMKRDLIEQFCEILLRHPPLRHMLPVAKNDSLEEVSPNRYRFLRPGYWSPDKEGTTLTYNKHSLVHINLQGSLIVRIFELLDDNVFPYSDLLSQLQEEFKTKDVFIQQTIDRLLDIGAVLPIPPWRSNDMHVEETLLRFLRSSLTSVPEVTGLIELLDELLVLEDGYAKSYTADQAVESVRRSQQIADQMWALVANLGNLKNVDYERPIRSSIHEDVLLISSSPDYRSISSLSTTTLERVLASVRPLIRLNTLLDHQIDFLHTLAAFSAQRWPSEKEVGCLDFFVATQDIWREYTDFENRIRRFELPRSESFNPAGLKRMESIAEWRRMVLAELPKCVEMKTTGIHVLPGLVDEFLDQLPQLYTSDREVCLFLQPADEHGDLWVQNGIYEAGRYHTRYTSVMNDTLRQRLTSHYLSRSTVSQSGQTGELVEVLCSGGRTLNLHEPQTPRVILLPGEHSDLPPERVLRLRDLRVRLEPGALPFITDSDGVRLLPTYMGTTVLRYMPVLQKFLCLFGSSLIELAFPPTSPESIGDLTIVHRLSIGNLVLRRKRWRVQPADLLALIRQASDDRAFALLNQWRISRGMPAQIFVARRKGLDYKRGKYKPQFIDFTSPMFVHLLRFLLTTKNDTLDFEEALPAMHQMPRDSQGTRWAFEVQLDSMAMKKQQIPRHGAARHLPELFQPGPLGPQQEERAYERTGQGKAC